MPDENENSQEASPEGEASKQNETKTQAPAPDNTKSLTLKLKEVSEDLAAKQSGPNATERNNAALSYVNSAIEHIEVELPAEEKAPE